MQEKADVVEAINDAEERARVNFSLAAKLDNVIGEVPTYVCDLFCNAPRRVDQVVAVSKVLCCIPTIRLM